MQPGSEGAIEEDGGFTGRDNGVLHDHEREPEGLEIRVGAVGLELEAAAVGEGGGEHGGDVRDDALGGARRHAALLLQHLHAQRVRGALDPRHLVAFPAPSLAAASAVGRL
eukprot:2585501-Rhodomonas_salina.6